MQTSVSASDCSSPTYDDDVPLVVDALDKDPTHHVSNISVNVKEEPKTLENPKQDQVGKQRGRRMIAYDELNEILSWMPAKSAIKNSSSLCKWLCNIHLDSSFIKKQCIRSCGQDNGIFLQYKHGNDEQVQNRVEFHVLPCENRSTFGIPLESLNYLSKYGRILSSSNGILLLGAHSLTGTSTEFRVCNPATREWAPLSTPEGFRVVVNDDWSPLIECYPWGNDPLDDVEFPDDYTIALPVLAEPKVRRVSLEGRNISLTVVKESNKLKLLIYSNGRWEEELCDVSIEGRVVCYDTPVGIFSKAAKGLMVHYLCESDDRGYLEPYIAAFDIREKKLSREIKLPDEAVVDNQMYGPIGKQLWIFKWNETSICLVRWFTNISRTIAWVLDDCWCEGESWRLVMSVSEMDLWSDDYNCDWTMGVAVAGGGKGLLIATAPAYCIDSSRSRVPHPIGSRLFLYVVEGEGQGRLELVGDHHSYWVSVTFMSYANTLRPVSVHNAETHTY